MLAPVDAAAWWDWLIAPAVVVADVPTTRLEIIAFLSGAGCVWLVFLALCIIGLRAWRRDLVTTGDVAVAPAVTGS
jgi:nicotinamide mononucleotide transporter